MPDSALKRRNALFVLFLLPGLGMSSWVTRTPDVRDLVGANTAQMGLILFGLSVGSMIGILSSGPLVSRLGTRPIIVAGMLSTAVGVGVGVGVGVVGLGAMAGNGALVVFGLALFGLGMGGGEVDLNVEGTEVERLLVRPVMPAMHGFFSLGTAFGACLGLFATALGFPVVAHMLIMSVVILAGSALSIGRIPVGFGRREIVDHTVTGSTPKAAPWRDTRLLLLGGVILALAMAEGTANDWLPLVVVSVVLWGLGASLGFPVALSAAGDTGREISGAETAARVSFAATIGYIAFLVGPPVLGILGEQLGLRPAMTVVLALVIVAALLTPAARTPRPTNERKTEPVGDRGHV